MPNFILCVGYALGKVHTGILCYISELFNEGHRAEAETLFAALGVFNLPPRLKAQREWNGIDLVISDNSTNAAICMIEIKVDDHEHTARGTKEWQTVAYTALLPDCKARLFVTLGAGEYYHDPRGPQFQWVRIREFYKSLCAMNTSDALVRSWIDAIGQEIRLQDSAAAGNMSLRDKYRTGTWNIYFLGQLKEASLSTAFPGRSDIDATAYMYGTRPDTILNFGWIDEHLYMEINNNGRLNLKATIECFEGAEERRAFIANQMQALGPKFSKFAPAVSNRDPSGGSHTIMSFDIGLTNVGSNQFSDGTLGYTTTPAHTVSTLREILSTFYG